MSFGDFDPNKSTSNKAKHGIDFIEARAIWNDADAETFDVAIVLGESRKATVGMIQGNIWVAIWTERADGIRILSVHRADNNSEFVRRYNGS